MRQWALVVVVVVLGCTSMVWGQGIQDTVFYDTFESGDTSGWWAPARVGKTGQTTCYDVDGTIIDCAGTGQDGEFQKGVEWPNPRFVDNSDGTVTDMLTGLVWLKDASCADLGPNGDGTADWATALMAAAALADGTCGLTDGSVAGDWHLPSYFELVNLLDLEYTLPALSNGAGTAKWSEGDVFAGVRSSYYWSSTSRALNPLSAWSFVLGEGALYSHDKTSTAYVWPVRAGGD